jgi:hypothetical protein
MPKQKMNEDIISDDFFKQHANFAMVLNTDLKTIERIKKFLVEEGIKVIYQKTSLAKLFIKEK